MVMLTVALAGLAPGVTEFRESEQEARVRVGGKEHATEIALPKEPICGLIVKLKVADWPGRMVAVVSAKAMEKSVTVTETISGAESTWPSFTTRVMFEVPTGRLTFGAIPVTIPPPSGNGPVQRKVSGLNSGSEEAEPFSIT